MNDKVETFFEHHGVKGMHWGRRKNDGEPTEVSVSSTPGKKVTAKGGANQPAHADAKKAAASKQVAKKSSTDALSTPELQALVLRMNLEQQYSKLSAGQVSPGKKWVNDLLLNTVKQQASKVAQDQAGKLIGEALKKKAAA